MLKYSNGNKYQKGQALPLGIAFLMGSLLFGIVMFNTGQLATEKSRLANTADAAVYSGLIWQARALNFQAYTNRAMVANQVSIGQMVSLGSWMKYASISIRNLDFVANFVWPMKAYTQPAKQIIDKVDDVVVALVEGAIPVVDTVNSVLGTAQKSIYLSSFAATPALVKEVVEENDSRYNVESEFALLGLGENLNEWKNFTKRYEDRASLLRKADIVNRSKDEFTEARNLGQGDMLPGVPDKLYLVPGFFRVYIKKEGKTNLVVEQDSSGGNGFGSSSNDVEFEWKGKDTLSLHIEVKKFKRGRWKWVKTEIPLGWGSRYLNGDFECEDDEDGYEVCLSYMDKNTLAEDFADAENEEIDADYEGLRAYYDLKDLTQNNKDPRLVLSVEVQTPESGVETSTKVDGIGSPGASTDSKRNGIGGGMFWAGDKMAASSMASISSGEVFFHPPDDYRPDRRQGKIELGNLFSPYWEVRLSKTPIERRFMAWGLRDSNLLTDGASGISEGVAMFVNQQAEDLQQMDEYAQQLANQIANTTDPAELAGLQQELAAVQSLMQLQQTAQQYEDQAQQLSQEFGDGLQQGLSDAAQAQVAQYEQQLEQYMQQAEQIGQDMATDFKDQVVDQVTGQIEQALQDAIKDAAKNAVSSFGL